MKSATIFSLCAPYNNQFQGTSTRIVFVCSAGMLRSPTAADVATRLGYNARCCGSSPYALIPLSANLIAWAENIIFMSNENMEESLKTFAHESDAKCMLSYKSIIWSIPDVYDRNDPELIRDIEARFASTFTNR